MFKKILVGYDGSVHGIRWDFLERCQKSLATFKTTFNQMVEEVVEEIKRVLNFALAEKQKGMSQVEATIATIRRQNQELEEIARVFAAGQKAWA